MRAEELVRHAIADLQTLRVMPDLTEAAHAKVIEAIKALREVEGYLPG
jgi:hypothetical protein